MQRTASFATALLLMIAIAGCSQTQQAADTSKQPQPEIAKKPAPLNAKVIEAEIRPGQIWNYSGPYLTGFNILGSARHTSFNISHAHCRQYELSPKQRVFAFYSSDTDTSVFLFFRSTELERSYGRTSVATRDGTLEAWMLRDTTVRNGISPDFDRWSLFIQTPPDERGKFLSATPLQGNMHIRYSGDLISGLRLELHSNGTVPKFDRWLEYHELLYRKYLNRDEKLLSPSMDAKKQRLIASQIQVWHQMISDIKARRESKFTGLAIIDGTISGAWEKHDDVKMLDPVGNIKPVGRLLN